MLTDCSNEVTFDGWRCCLTSRRPSLVWVRILARARSCLSTVGWRVTTSSRLKGPDEDEHQDYVPHVLGTFHLRLLINTVNLMQQIPQTCGHSVQSVKFRLEVDFRALKLFVFMHGRNSLPANLRSWCSGCLHTCSDNLLWNIWFILDNLLRIKNVQRYRQTKYH